MGVTIDNFFELINKGQISQGELDVYHPLNVSNKSGIEIIAIKGKEYFHLFETKIPENYKLREIKYLDTTLPIHLNGDLIPHNKLFPINFSHSVEDISKNKATLLFNGKEYNQEYHLVDNGKSKYYVDKILISKKGQPTKD
jgi:hypothetical protein